MIQSRRLGSLASAPLLLVVAGCALAACALTGCAVPQPEDALDSGEPTGEKGDPVSTGTVEDAMKTTCVTSSVTPLSQQIIDEMRCLEPDALVEVPDAPNLTFAPNVFHYLDLPGKNALAKALASRPNQQMHVNSMFRTIAQQYLLYRWYQSGRCGIGLAAKPGASNHESGLAMDVQESGAWRTALGAKGFKWFGNADPVHYDFVGQGSHTLAGLDVKAFQRLWNANHPNDLISEDGSWGPATSSRLGKTPAKGFAKGASCSQPSSPQNPDPQNPDSNPPSNDWYKPGPSTTWQWQLSGTLDTSIDASVYDVDLFTTSDADLATLKAAGRKVICYFSAGSYEPYRPDAAQFSSQDLGKVMAGWPDEKWLDTRSANVRNIVRARLDLAKSRGCDGVEPDNVDGYANDTGLPLTAATQLDFNQFLATEAHARGLSVGLKNDTDQAGTLAPSFDWALNEECVKYDECSVYEGSFIAAGKAVFHAEYATASQLSSVCAVTKPLGLSTIVKHVALDAYRLTCP